MTAFERLLSEVRACSACDGKLPFAPRPVLQASSSARLLIAGQAPGSRVQQSGVPFSDASGERLREWMGVTPDQFYDARLVAIVPMGLCYPGRGKNADNPPRPECAPLWRDKLLAQMPSVQLTLLIGIHAQEAALAPGRMIDRVRRFEDFLPNYFPLPHPSWRSGAWMRRNPWFEADVLPRLRAEVAAALQMPRSQPGEDQ